MENGRELTGGHDDTLRAAAVEYQLGFTLRGGVGGGGRGFGGGGIGGGGGGGAGRGKTRSSESRR